MYYMRRTAQALLSLSSGRIGRGLILTGARQTGKTTLLERELVPPYELYSFDEPLARQDLMARPAAAWIREGSSYVFDEVQKAPDFLGTVKVILDRGGPEQRVVLSGSAQIRLLAGVKETLAGRVVSLELFPLLAAELAEVDEALLLESLLRCQTQREASDLLAAAAFGDPRIDNAIRQALQTLGQVGGMPALLALEEEAHRWLWLREYCGTYLERDVADLGRVADLEDFLRLQRVAARRTGCVVNYADLARDADLAPLTAKRYLRYLELSYQTFLLEAFRAPGRARLTKAPRLHFVDLGVQRVLSGLRGEMTGEQRETLIVSEVYKLLKTLRIEAELRHLRTKDGREVDLLIRNRQGAYVAIEVKSTSRPAPAHAKHLRGLEAILDGPLLASIVVHTGHLTTKLPGGAHALPASRLLGPAP